MKVNLDLTKGIPANHIIDEYFTSVGSSKFSLAHDRFRGSTDMVIRTAAGGGGTLLTETTDYALEDTDADLTTRVGANVYASVHVTNPTYQTGTLYISYWAVADAVDAADSLDIERTATQYVKLNSGGDIAIASTNGLTIDDDSGGYVHISAAGNVSVNNLTSIGDVAVQGGVQIGATAQNVLYTGGSDLLVYRNYSQQYSELLIWAPTITSITEEREATIALVRALNDESKSEYLDLYNESYSSETQYGIRIGRFGTGTSFHPFVIDFYDGTTKTQAMVVDFTAGTTLKAIAGSLDLVSAGTLTFKDSVQSSARNFSQTNADGFATEFAYDSQTDFNWSVRSISTTAVSSVMGALNSTRQDLYEFVELLRTQGAVVGVAAGANLVGTDGITGVVPTGKSTGDASNLQEMLEGIFNSLSLNKAYLNGAAVTVNGSSPVWTLASSKSFTIADATDANKFVVTQGTGASSIQIGTSGGINVDALGSIEISHNYSGTGTDANYILIETNPTSTGTAGDIVIMTQVGSGAAGIIDIESGNTTTSALYLRAANGGILGESVKGVDFSNTYVGTSTGQNVRLRNSVNNASGTGGDIVLLTEAITGTSGNISIQSGANITLNATGYTEALGDFRIPTSAPGSPSTGSMYIDAASNKLYVYYSSGWHYTSMT